MKRNAMLSVFLREKTLKFKKILMIFTLLLSCIMQLNASVGWQKNTITINEKNIDLPDLIFKIGEEMDCKFIFNYDDLDEFINLTVNKRGTIDEVLTFLLKDKGLTYTVNENSYIIRKAERKPDIEQTQEKKEIKGKVTDKDGTPLPGVSVVIKGTNTGVATDIYGNYSLDIEQENAVLVFSFVGMLVQEIKYYGQQIQNVELIYDVEGLEEVVVIGYGTMKKKDLTGAVSRLDSEVLEASNAPSLGNIIQGQLPGVDVLSGTGAPGEPVRIRIRGDATMNNGADPLIVVNGVPMSEDYNLNDINPNDIEALDVLKGASATAIYGSRASAGVLEITTKKGSEYTKPEISYSYNHGFKHLRDDINALNADQFKMMFEEGMINYIKGRYGVRSEEEARNYTTSSGTNILDYWMPDDKFGDSNTNWVDLLIGTAQTQEHHLSLRGGDEKIQYSFSYGYNKEDGMLAGSDFERHTGNFSYDQKFNENIKLGFNLMGSSSDRNNTVSMSQATKMRPDIPAYNDDGSYHTHSYVYYGSTYLVDNPLVLANDVTNNTKTRTFRLSPYAEVKFLKDFKFTSLFSYYLSTSQQEQFWPSTTEAGRYYFYNASGQLVDTQTENNNLTFTNYFTYLKEINDHNITATLGMSYDTWENKYVKERYLNFADDKIQNEVWQATDYLGASGDKSETAAVGYYGRLFYKYKDRYLLSASLRVDGSSRFAPDNRYGVFPALALGYIVSEEAFFDKIKSAVSLLKFRASVGKTGNDRVGAYSWLAQYESGIDYLDQPGVRPTDLGNDKLKWESTTEYNFGVDFGFLKDSRIRGSLDVYKKDVDNILFGMPMAPSSGVTSVTQNFASLTNKGVELNISGVVINNKDFNWTIGFNLSKNKNKLTKLGVPRASTTSGATWLAHYIIEEGQPLGLVYGYKTDGLFTSWNEVDEYEALNPDKKYQEPWSYTIPGDIKFVDTSGDGYVGAGSGKDDDPNEDRRILGSTEPDFWGGCFTTLEYRGLRLDIRGTFQKGGVKYWKHGESQFQMNIVEPGNVDAIALQRWTPGSTKATYPAMRNSYHTNKTNDFWLYDASYFKLQEMSLSYYVPQKLLKKIGVIKRLSVYASVNNVAIFTKYPGYNIESYNADQPLEGTIMDNSAYPSERTIRLGARIVF